MTAVISDKGISFGNTSAATNGLDVSAVASGNTLVCTLQPCTLSWRNPTLTNGQPVTAEVSNAITITLPTGATLGQVNNTQADFAIVCYYNGGVPVLGAINIGGGAQLDETNVVSPTTISASATSASTHYSASSVSANSPYKIVGLVRHTQVTAGTYAAQPTVVQGIGGQALAAMASLGYGQTPQLVTRNSGTTYYNTTAKPIVWEIQLAASGNLTATIAGVVRAVVTAPAATTTTTTYIVPPGVSYSYVQGAGTSTHIETR